MLKTILVVVIALLLGGYSCLRYHYLWSRMRIPLMCYYVFQAVLLGTLFVCFFFTYYINNDVMLFVIQLISCIYIMVMLVTPVFSMIRGAVRMIGKRAGWKNRFFFFFNHPTKVSKIVLVVTILMGIAFFVQIKIPQISKKTVQINKQASVNSLTVAAVSDLQIGRCMTRHEIDIYFEKLKQCQPDYVIFLGNIYSYPANRNLREYTYKYLKQLAGDIPVYWVEGPNEENQKESVTREIRSLGVKILQDELIQLSNGIQLVGCRYQKDKKKKDITFICSLLDKNKPAIVLSYEDFKDKEKRPTDSDLLLHAETHYEKWISPKQISLFHIQFKPRD